jgi:tryptophanyl-tRNA synthetase
MQQVLDLHQGQGFGPFKAALTEVVVNEIAPIALKTSQLLRDETYLVQMLHNGAQRAQAIAEPIVAEAEKLVGFVKPL